MTVSIDQGGTETQATVYQAARPTYHARATDNAHEVAVLLPGVRRDAIHVRYNDGKLEVEGRREAAVIPGARALYSELPAMGYQLVLDVRLPVNAQGITARHEDGVLVLRLPYREEPKTREIPVG